MSTSTAKSQGTSTLKPSQTFEGHTDWVEGAIHPPGGERIITCSHDGSLRMWNLKSGEQIGDDWRDGDKGVFTMALSPDGKKIVSGSGDGVVRLWDIDTCEVIARFIGHTRGVWSVCWSRDGSRVVSGAWDRTARQWDVETGETILAPIETGHENVYAVVYSPDTAMIATAGPVVGESSVRIWDAKTGHELHTPLKVHTSRVYCLQWTADGKTLISGSYDGSIRTWNTTTWQQTALLNEHIEGIYALALSSNSRILASASFDQTARLWNLDSGESIGPPLQHARALNCVSFSRDGKILVTGCEDNKAYTWNVSGIIREVGLDKLIQGTKRLDVSHGVPSGFFNDTPNRAHLAPPPRSVVLPHEISLLDRFHSLFHPTQSNAPSRSRPFSWDRKFLFKRQHSQSGADIELQEHRSAVAEVPLAKGKRRNASAREKRRTFRSNSNNLHVGSSRPPQSNRMPHRQSSSQVLAATPSTTTTFLSTTSRASRLDATIRQPGRWSRFWLYVCCASPEYTEGRH